jgi:hypothetical protein
MNTMKKYIFNLRTIVLLSLTLLSVQLIGQAKGNSNSKDYEPKVGQAGKDVVWVPTPQELVDKMLEMAAITTSDLLIDLGSGDGRTVITAAKRGTRAIGIEYNPDMVSLSKQAAIDANVSDKTEFLVTDLFEYDFSKATVLTMFLLPEINLRLRPKILEMRPGTRVVSNTFSMNDWVPDDTVYVEDPSIHWSRAYLWIVPAKAGGTWRLQSGEELIILQEFQMISGEIGNENMNEIIRGGKLRGNEITFNAGKTTYKGVVNGNNMSGTATNGSNSKNWKASR